MKPLLDFHAANPDRWIPFTEASAALGFDSQRSMPGLLGSFGLRSNHRYGGRSFETSQHDDLWHMRMDERVPEAIQAVRDEYSVLHAPRRLRRRIT